MSRDDTDLSTEQVISGLTNRQGYVIEVAAVNEIGRGPWASGMTAPQGPQSPPSDPTDVAPARFSLGPLGAFWTDGYPATGPHPDRDPLNGNLISTPCAGDTGFTVLWGTHDEAPLEYEAHFITRYGAGTFRHSFVENKTLTGSVKIHGHSILTVRVRARFEDEGWGPWSRPVSLSCTNQQPNEETSQLQVSEEQRAEPVNSPATNQPVISGGTREGDTLTVSTSQIADANGMNDASFTYQWSRYNGTTTTAIEGAASATYTVHEDDVGNQVSVTVSFADDDGFQESVTSDSVLVSPPSPLYGGFDADTVPQDHNGQDPFTFQIHFSEEPSLGYAAVRDHVLTVTGGTATGASQTTPEENIRWTITLQPDGDGRRNGGTAGHRQLLRRRGRLHRQGQDALQCHKHHRGRTRNRTNPAGKQPGHRPAHHQWHGPGGPDPHRRRLRRLRWRRPDQRGIRLPVDSQRRKRRHQP